MMYEITTSRPTCCCTATVCSCFNQGGTPATTVISETCPTHISSNQIVWWVDELTDESDFKIEPATLREREPPPRYVMGEAAKARTSPPVKPRMSWAFPTHRRERGHAIGHSPRRRAR